jgi:hypothetical protein
MKTILTLLAAVSALGFAIPSTASADHGESRRIVSHLPCGRPVYAHYEVCGYDRYGRPVGHWETKRVSCACPVCRPRPVVHTRPSCAAPAHGHRHVYVKPGIGLSFSFGR